MKTFSILTLAFRDSSYVGSLNALKGVVPPLAYSNHKGVMGRIGVIGGSKDYTGAPFYAADGALKFGADLTFVLCSSEAAVPIKSYSPELMVSPFYDDTHIINEAPSGDNDNRSISSVELSNAVQRVISMMSRLHALVIGPGLGRSEALIQVIADVIKSARKDNKHIVIDADGLWMISHRLSTIRGYSRCILTPNKVEYDRLVEVTQHELLSMQNSLPQNDERSHSTIAALLAELGKKEDPSLQIRALSLALGGVTILKKGEEDLISNGKDVFSLKTAGSPRRCGGQGDILAGALGTAFYWTSLMTTESIDAYQQLVSSPSSSSASSAVCSEGEEEESGKGNQEGGDSGVIKQSNIQSQIDLSDIIDLYTALQSKKQASAAAAGGEEDEVAVSIESDDRLLLSKARTIQPVEQLMTTGTVTPSAASRTRDAAMLASVVALLVVKKASQLAYAEHGRSMTSPDMLKVLGKAFATYFP